MPTLPVGTRASGAAWSNGYGSSPSSGGAPGSAGAFATPSPTSTGAGGRPWSQASSVPSSGGWGRDARPSWQQPQSASGTYPGSGHAFGANGGSSPASFHGNGGTSPAGFRGRCGSGGATASGFSPSGWGGTTPGRSRAESPGRGGGGGGTPGSGLSYGVGFGFGAPKSGLANLVQQVEEEQEHQYCDMMARTNFPKPVQTSQMPSLPSSGAWDQLLLQGSARELLMKLADLFEWDPPPDGGRMPARCGMFHSYEGTYGTKVFSPDAVVKMFGQAAGWWNEAPNILRLSIQPQTRLIVVGDTHGQLEDVLWMFFKYGVPSRSNQYLFVGDIVDRGGHALEILLLLFAFKREAEESVHILRGNHEDVTTCSTYGFRAEIESKFGQHGGWVFYHIAHQVLPLLPVASLLSDAAGLRSVFVVHGGIPVPGPVTLQRIEAVNRKVPSVCTYWGADRDVLYNLMWADPLRPRSSGVDNGRGNAFSEKETYEFCQVNQVSCVIRAHQLPPGQAGFEVLHQNRCWTVFSASNYCGNAGNRGGVLICDCRERNIFGESGPQPKEHWAPAWPQLVAVLRKHDIVSTPAEQRKAACRAVEAPSAPPTLQEQQREESQQLSQIELFAVDEICKHKQDIFQAFADADASNAGTIPLQAWAQCMARSLPDMPRHPELWRKLASKWGLEDHQQVAYVHFLHRFQILSERGPGKRSTHVDMLSAMSQLRLSISDEPCQELVAALDTDFSGLVDLSEFAEFLTKYGVPMPQWQAAAVYEALFAYLGRQPNLEDVLTALALISSSAEGHVANPGGTAWTDTARHLGEEIAKTGSRLAFFRRFDQNGDGFMVADELQKALVEGVPRLGAAFDEPQLQALVRHMDCQGVENGRVSVIEFLRAVGPAKLATALHSAMLGEVLKPVYFHRAMLGAFLARLDSSQSNMVSTEQFVAGLQEMNRQQRESGQQMLTSYQVNAVGEIASGGAGQVQYRDFLQSLRAVDTVRRRAMGDAGRFAAAAALANGFG